MQNGTYNYFLNGEPTDVIETFNVEILPDGAKFTTSTRDAKPYGTTITVKMIERDNQFKRVEIRFANENQVHAIYKFQEQKVSFVHEKFPRKTTSELLDLPIQYAFFPLMRCFQGQTILQVAKNKDFTTVIVPDIQPSTAIENLLKPTFDERTAKFLKKETITFYEPESVSIEADLYQYLSKHYDDNSQFWINDEGFLVAYKFVQSPDKIWEIYLQT